MNWQGKEIKELSKEEIQDALISCGDIDNYRFDKLSQKRKRHKTLFDKHPPVENPNFTQLVNELNKQYRKLENA